MLTQEELDRALELVGWDEVDPESDDEWKKESGRRLIRRLERLQVHWHHVRIWRGACCSAVAVTLVIGWFVGTTPLRTAIHATAELSPSIRLLQQTQEEAPSPDATEPLLHQMWKKLIVLVTPGARSAAVTDARWDSATGLVRAEVRGVDGYILVDPRSASLVGVVGMKIPADASVQESSMPLFVRLELARQLTMADPLMQTTGRQAVAVSSLLVYHLESTNHASAYPTSEKQQRIPPGTLVAVLLQKSNETGPDLIAIVDTDERRVVQVVNSARLRGLVVSSLIGTYAVMDSSGN
ncbi:MAG: hypothetical protein NTZ77_07740 [Caldiserica bacterium]|nr:hypothetical protein [Caldisericota bacterium]